MKKDCHSKNLWEHKRTYRNYKIVHKRTKRVVLETPSSKRASRFLKAYDLYLFHVVNGHRQYRLHHNYDVYVNDVKLISKSNYLHEDAIVKRDTTFYFSFNFKKIKVYFEKVVHDKEYDYLHVTVLIEDKIRKYFFFNSKKQGNFRNVKSHIRNYLLTIKF